MRNQKQSHRRSLRAFTFGAAVAFLLSAGSAAAQAAPALANSVPAGPMSIEIHKFEQPDHPGVVADGLEITDPSLLPTTDPVAGATFVATRVPGIDVLTNEGQREAAALGAGQAAQRIADGGVMPSASGTTNGAGGATLVVSDAGVYLVEETVSPVGFVAADPFLVALPLTHPQDRDSWLSTVHVYPKNSRLSIALSVHDADAITLGDTVRWQARAAIPRRVDVPSYVIRMKIDSRLELVDEVQGFRVALDCSGCTSLLQDTHFTPTFDAATGEYVFVFTPAGRSALAAAVVAYPTAVVTVDYATRVLASGVLQNDASLHVGGAVNPVTDRAFTKWGPVAIEVHEKNYPSNVIPGAHFQLFLSAEDAAAGRNAVVANGVSKWVTDANGRIAIDGLRFSNFANGLDLAQDDPLFRHYYVIITKIPRGYAGDVVPIQLTVISDTQPALAIVELQRSERGGLVVTGAQSAGLVLLAAALIGGGFVLFVRRRGRTERGTPVGARGERAAR